MQQTHWPNNRGPNRHWRALAHLAACVVVVAIVWLGILPFIGRQPRIRSYISRNERLGIDPSAKFYTELPAMPELLERVRQRRLN
jgi:hypothetical protein